MTATMGSSYRKGLTLSLGSVIQTQVDLFSVVPSQQRDSLHRMCPTHKVRLVQAHKCPEGDHEVASTEWVMGRENGSVLQIAPATAKPQVEAQDVLELKPVPASEVNASTFEGNGIYYAKPSAATSQAWLALQAILEKGKIALIAKGAFRRGSDKLWRLQVFNGYLVLREIVFPEDIREAPEPLDTKLEKGTLTLVEQYLEGLITSWDKIDTTNRSREELQKWLESGESKAIEGPPASDEAAGLSLMEQLKQATSK